MQHRRLMILFALIALFAFGVILWYFLFSTPTAAPTLTGTVSPLSLRDLPARFGFIFNNDAPTSTTETEVTQPGAEAFIQVWNKPSTGNVFVSKDILKEITATTTVGTTTVLTTKTVRATTTVLMFVDRGTGYVYGHSLDTGVTYQISNTTVPGVYDAYIWGAGDKILMRYLDTDKQTIVSIFASIPDVTEGRDAQPLINITTLPKNITSVSVDSTLSSLSYLVPNTVGSSIYTMTTKGTVKVADSPFSEWTLSYGGKDLFVTTRASAYIEGGTYVVPSFTRIIGEKTGLTSTPSQNGLLLNSMWAQSGLVTFSTIGSTNVTFQVKTLASKCSALITPYFLCGIPKSLPESSEGLPDDWYQGRVSFDDTLVMLNAGTGESYTLYEPSKFGSIDITHIRTTLKGDLVSFIRKQDSTLFLFNANIAPSNAE